MEDQSSLLQGTMQEDSFEVVMRGYNKRQVDDYVLQCQHHIRDLAQRLALTEQEIERVRVDAAAALEKVSTKPVHEEVSERLAQILRLASEEAERERANAADEIAALRAAALADTQNLRELAQQEAEELRQQAFAETDAQREMAQAETDALRGQANAETDALRGQANAESDALLRQAEIDAADERERAQLEAERLVGEAKAVAEHDVAQARAQAQDLEDTARAQSEELVRVAQERADSLVGEAERRATAINTVLGGRLEALTATHQDVVARLFDLRDVLVGVLAKEENEVPFEVPPPAVETMNVSSGTLPTLADPYVQTAGEVAAAYEASAPASGLEVASGHEMPSWRPVTAAPVERPLEGSEMSSLDTPPGAQTGPTTLGEVSAERRVSFGSAAERTRRI